MVSTAELYQKYLSCHKIITDTRKITPGGIFFALKGESFNGNDFATQAIAQGCVWAVVDDPSLFDVPQCLPVEDVLSALQSLALFHRKHLSIPVMGITGTNGKTTTKDLIVEVLSQQYRVVATRGNFNNHIGVPLTLLSVAPDTDLVIVEMGANHLGEIASLCAMALPDYGMITNIGKAHLEGFGDFSGVIRAKNELYDFLREHEGHIFVNRGNPLLMRLLKDFPGTLSGYISGTAHELLADDAAAGVVCSGRVCAAHPALEVELNFGDSCLSAQTQLVGSYNLDNILAAACVGAFWHVSAHKIVFALEQYAPTNFRSQWFNTDKNQLLLDYYNANPSSMLASLQNFLSLKPAEGLVVLGDMFELGVDSLSEHRAIIQWLDQHPEMEAWVVGSSFFDAAKGRLRIKSFGTMEETKAYLTEHPLNNRTILLKGSRGMHMEQLMSFL